MGERSSLSGQQFWKECNVEAQLTVERTLMESFALSVEAVVKMLVGEFAELGGLEIKGLKGSSVDRDTKMTIYTAMARVVARHPRMCMCIECLKMFIEAYRNPEFDPQFWDDDIGEAVARVLAAWPDASDEDVIRLYGECEANTNAILANPYVGQAVGKFLSRNAMMGELSEQDTLLECIRTVAGGNGELAPETARGVPASYLH